MGKEIGVFENREQAGALLAEKLKKYAKTEAVVMAIPRGGVPIGYQIATSLGLRLDIALTKKIGHPFNPEFAIGSVSLDTVILDPHPGIPEEYIRAETDRIRNALREKLRLYKGNIASLSEDVKCKVAIVVDDGIATGNTVLSTIELLRKGGAAKVVVAVPVIPFEKVAKFEKAADEFICLLAPRYFPGVGAFYEEFYQVSDEEVIRLLKESNRLDHRKGVPS